MFPKDVILGLACQFSPIVFPILKLHSPYNSMLFLSQKAGISAYCLVYHTEFSVCSTENVKVNYASRKVINI